MKQFALLLLLTTLINSKSLIACNESVIHGVKNNDIASNMTERGLEIRYYVFDTRPTTLPTEVTIDHVKYKLFKSKEEAIDSVKYSGVKNDYTVVYVVSTKTKDSEIIAIQD